VKHTFLEFEEKPRSGHVGGRRSSDSRLHCNPAYKTYLASIQGEGDDDGLLDSASKGAPGLQPSHWNAEETTASSLTSKDDESDAQQEELSSLFSGSRRSSVHDGSPQKNSHPSDAAGKELVQAVQQSQADEEEEGVCRRWSIGTQQEEEVCRRRSIGSIMTDFDQDDDDAARDLMPMTRENSVGQGPYPAMGSPLNQLGNQLGNQLAPMLLATYPQAPAVNFMSNNMGGWPSPMPYAAPAPSWNSACSVVGPAHGVVELPPHAKRAAAAAKRINAIPENRRNKYSGSQLDMGARANVPPATASEVPEGTWTTVMLRNLPEGFTRLMLCKMCDKESFAHSYDFLYMPINFRTETSFGYAFINLTRPADAKRCYDHFQGFNRWEVPSDKVCEVTWSKMYQGLAAHIERYRNSPVMHEAVPDEYRPAVFKNGIRVAFPMPTKKLRMPRIRRMLNDSNDAEEELGEDESQGSLSPMRVNVHQW